MMTAVCGAEITETHISYVILLGDRAYKLKKPVRFPFVDQSTREAREKLCHREVDLNRRLAPDVYLGVLDIIDDEGSPVDHLVEMRRMPGDRRLSTLVANGSNIDACLRELARDIATFHSAAQTSDEISACASQAAVRRTWSENLSEMSRFVGAVVDPEVFERVESRVERYLAGRMPLFDSRAVSRHARDGHGDLLADDVFCLEDGPRALDCIDFDDRLRWGDVVADVAFLAMDLERIGAADAADRFLAWYREFSGESYPQSLADHYIAYRASVRSKIACIKHEQGDVASRELARALMDLCDRRLERARVRLVLVGGLPGTGKSTVAEGLSARTGWALLRSDEVRKDLTRMGHAEHSHYGFGEGIYSVQLTDRTYTQLLAHAGALLEHGESVILDASWLHAGNRGDALRLARETHSDLVSLRCVLDPIVAAQRMRVRRAIGTDPSDADASVAQAMAASMDPWLEAVDVSTAATPDDAIDDALRLSAAA